MDILSLSPHRRLVSLQLGSLSETKRETIFEKPSHSGRSVPVSSIGWLWSNDAAIRETLEQFSGFDITLSMTFHHPWRKGQKCTSGNPSPSTVSIG